MTHLLPIRNQVNNQFIKYVKRKGNPSSQLTVLIFLPASRYYVAKLMIFSQTHQLSDINLPIFVFFNSPRKNHNPPFTKTSLQEVLYQTSQATTFTSHTMTRKKRIQTIRTNYRYFSERESIKLSHLDYMLILKHLA